jgi:hypothetical protein
MGILSKFTVPKLPDRTVIFLSALYFWAYMMFYFTKVINISLGFALRHTPDAFVIHKRESTLIEAVPLVKRINIIQAMAGNIPITNKIKNVIQSHWNKEIGEDDDGVCIGGIKVCDVLSFVKSPMIWISYLFEFDKKLSEMSDDEIGKAIKTILVDFGDKAIYRDSDLCQKEDMLFGEIPL